MSGQVSRIFLYKKVVLTKADDLSMKRFSGEYTATITGFRFRQRRRNHKIKIIVRQA